MEILDAFKEAISNCPSTNMEIAWNMGVEPMRLQAILEGARYTDAEELFIHRFLFKYHYKLRSIRNIVIGPQMEQAPQNGHPEQQGMVP